MAIELTAKVPILKEVTLEKCNSVELNTFSTYLSSLLGVIAIVLDVGHIQNIAAFKRGMYFLTICPKTFEWQTNEIRITI